MESLVYLIPLFFLTALLYSTVGFGGGSTYLALLVLFSVPYTEMPKVALACNIVVVAGGCYFFIRAGYFSLRKVLPFIVTSIPAAYLAGSVTIGKAVFMWLLFISLAVAGLRMLLSEHSFKVRKEVTWSQAWLVGLPIGALLGALSGLVGIGGGIFLAPVLLLLGWAHAKEVAAAASFFILVNSAAGLLGQFSKGAWLVELGFLIPLLVAVFLGGQIGSRLGSGAFSKVALQRLTAVLILFVSGRLLWGLL